MKLLLKITIVLTLTLLGFSRESPNAFGRGWKDKTGQHELQAEFEYVDPASNKVWLRSEKDGARKGFPIHILSPLDIQHIRKEILRIDSYEKLTRRARQQSHAADVLELYQQFLCLSAPGSEDYQQVKHQIQFWEKRASERRINVAGEWLTPEELEGKRKAAEQFIDKALALFNAGDTKSTIKLLRKARQEYQAGAKANFIMGMIYALSERDLKEAVSQFGECGKRLETYEWITGNAATANRAAALNNRALASLRLGKHDTAIRDWKTAMELISVQPEMIQNLGLYVHMAATSSRVKKSTTQKVQKLYAEAAGSIDFKFRKDVGWLYMPFFLEEALRPASVGGQRQAGQTIHRETSFGTGFVVDKDYIITSHHVINGAVNISVVEARNSGTRLPAEVIAVAENHDLALIHCKLLKAKSLSLAPSPPDVGDDVMSFGYPGSDRNVTDTKGTIMDLPNNKLGSFKLRDRFIISAKGHAGESGGPVCDENGHVFSVIASSGTWHGADVTLGIPAQHIGPLIRKQNPSFRMTTSSSGKLTWGVVAGNVSPSTIQLIMSKVSTDFGLGARIAPKIRYPKVRLWREKNWHAFEDRACMACNGKESLECPIRECARGSVPHIWVEKYYDRSLNSHVTKQHIDRKRCNTCKGTSRVECPHCRHGIDRKFL